MAVRIQDGSGNNLTSTGSALDINVKSSSGSQTVSGTVAVSNFPATQPVSGAVSVSNFPATQPVSGSVTANVGTTNGLALDATLTSGSQKTKIVDAAGTNQAAVSAAGAVKVDGSAATQPVSGTVAVSNFPATQPVSGTIAVSNFPATQTVAGTVTANAGTGTMAVSAAALPLPAGAATAAKQPALGVAGTPSADVLSVQGIASMTPLKTDGSATTQPVSGTVAVSNFPATQPVSGTVTANAGTGTMAVSAAALPLPAGASTAAKQPALGVAGTPSADILTVQGAPSMTALKVDGSAVTQPVSGTVGVNNFPATQTVAGTVAATQSGTWTVQPGNTPNTSAWLVAGATLTKGTQAATGFSIQELKDAGRVSKVFSATFTAATTEALVTLTPISAGVAGSTATTFAVTAGKTLRLQSMQVTVRNAGAAVQGCVVNLRVNAGVVAATSPLVATAGAGTLSATANIVGFGNIDFPDGLELSGTLQLGISQIGTATAGNTVTLIGYEY